MTMSPIHFVRTTMAVAAFATTLGLAACSTTDELPTGANGGFWKVGSPYQIKGVWYYPKSDPQYDETGIASWYGEYFHGKKTANGERYDMNQLTAAHRTLPMPTFVDVTNLENGKQLRLRVNDRGPYAAGRIIDVSKRAAELLGFQKKGVAKVRVTFASNVDGMGPTSENTIKSAPVAAVSMGELSPVGEGDTTDAPAVTRTASLGPDIPIGATATHGVDGIVRTVSVPSKTQIWVQTGSFETRGNAARQATQLSKAGSVVVAENRTSGRSVFRVRLGPIANVEDADAKLDQIIGLGFNGAQVVVD